jgi:hypothetical protein
MSQVGEFVSMTLEQLKEQVDNINNILLLHNKLLKYYIMKGEQQLVAGMNYKILIKNYKKYYLLEYFISLNNELLNVKITKTKIKLCIKGVIHIDDTFTIDCS